MFAGRKHANKMWGVARKPKKGGVDIYNCGAGGAQEGTSHLRSGQNPSR